MQTTSTIAFPQAGWLSAWVRSLRDPVPIGPDFGPCIPEDEHERSDEGQARIHESQREQRFTQRTPDEPPF